LLGLLKIFSLVSLYNQNKFEKELEASLVEPKIKDENIEGTLLLPSFNDLALNKSTATENLHCQDD